MNASGFSKFVIENRKIMNASFTAEKTIGDIVAKDFRTAAVFKKYNIDFCCRGNRSVEEVCEKNQIDLSELQNELKLISSNNHGDSEDFNVWELDILANYIEQTHHRYVEEKSVVLLQFLEKIKKVHGGNHPELYEIFEEFKAAAQALAAHLKKEELILFPFIRKMVKARKFDEPLPVANFGDVENPVAMMEHEHDIEGERFRKIAGLSNNYTAPADGCTTYRVAFAMLQEFEEDLHKHIHLENNILFPKAIEMQKQFT